MLGRKWPAAITTIGFATAAVLIGFALSTGCAAKAASVAYPHWLGVTDVARSIIQPAAFMPVEDDDGRPIPDTELDSLAANKRKIGFSDEDATRALATTGRVFCNDRKGREIDHGSGFLLLPNVLVTAAHGFREEGHPIPGLASCYFQAFASSNPMRLDLDRHAKFFTDDPGKAAGRDLVLIKLPNWVTNIEPFPFDEADRDLRHREMLVALTAYQGKYKTPSSSQPFAQLCTHRNRFRGNGVNLTLDYTDCAAHDGSSGGLILADDGGMRWCIREMILETGKPFLDGQRYNLENGSYTKAITIDSTVMRAARELSAEKAVAH